MASPTAKQVVRYQFTHRQIVNQWFRLRMLRPWKLLVHGLIFVVGLVFVVANFRNFQSIDEFRAIVYARPEYVETLATSTPIAQHVRVDFELQGCPIDKRQLVEVISAFLNGRKPVVPAHSVCVECKMRGNVCVMVAHGTPCLGPITHAGCGAICPRHTRGCYGCFGPMETPNAASLARRLLDDGLAKPALIRSLRTFNALAVPFRQAADALERGETAPPGDVPHG